MILESMALATAAIAGYNYDKIFNTINEHRTRKKIRQEFNRIFYALKIIDIEQKEEVYYRYTIGNENFIEFTFGLNENTSVKKFIDRKDEIMYKMDVDNLAIEAGQRQMYFRIKNTNKKALIFKFWDVAENEIPLGLDDMNNLITWDITKDAHMIIAGATGGGKSTLVRSMIMHISAFVLAEMILVDLKSGLEFGPLQELRGVTHFGDDIKTAISLISLVEEISKERLRKLRATSCKDISAYNSSNKTKMKRIFFIIDEFADLSAIRKKKDEEHPIDTLIELARKTRAVGIHLVLATQRPDAKVLTGELKANFTAIVGLRTTNAVNSRIIIDQNGLEELSRGESISLLDGQVTEFRGQLLEGRYLEHLIALNSIYKKKEDKTKETTGTTGAAREQAKKVAKQNESIVQTKSLSNNEINKILDMYMN